MPRASRRKSMTGIYHIVLKGMDDRNIFIEDEDKIKFIHCLKTAKEKGKFSLLAYCLMNNHVHLLIKEDEVIGTSIKRICVSYTSYHNNKYERSGHLFRNRFNSEVIEDYNYLKNVFRYIHQNPIKANLVSSIEHYSWTSYHQYLLAFNHKDHWIDAELITKFYNEKDVFMSYLNAPTDIKCLEVEATKFSDSQLVNYIIEKYNLPSPVAISTLNKKDRNKIIKSIYQKTNSSYRQMSRVLGVSRGLITRACND